MNTQAQPTKTITEQAARFADLVYQGHKAILEAGQLLVEMLDTNPDARRLIMEAHPDINEGMLSIFERIGRKQLHPSALLNNSPGMRRLRNMPYSEQERYILEPVPVLIKTEKGTDVLNVSVRNLTPEQAAQALSPDGVRPIEAQRALLEAPAKPPKPAREPYRIYGNRVIVSEPCTLTLRELKDLVEQLQS